MAPTGPIPEELRSAYRPTPHEAVKEIRELKGGLESLCYASKNIHPMPLIRLRRSFD